MNFDLDHHGYESYLEATGNANGGVWYRFKFDNGYGASVVKHDFSYGHNGDLWELAVLKFNGEGGWWLSYSTEITDDVIGNLTDERVRGYLEEIKNLPKK